MNDNDLIEYIDYAPVEAKWFRLELSFPSREGLYKFRASNLRLRIIKEFMAAEGFRINIDFRIDSMHYYNSIVIFLSPESEKFASMIMLKWNPKYE